MTIKQIKTKLHNYIDNADEHFLKALYAMLNEYMKINTSENDDFTKPGKPMKMKVLKKRISEAEKRINSGRYTTQEQLEKEMEKW